MRVTIRSRAWPAILAHAAAIVREYKTDLTDRPRVALYPFVDEEHGVAGGTREQASTVVGRSRLRR